MYMYTTKEKWDQQGVCLHATNAVCGQGEKMPTCVHGWT